MENNFNYVEISELKFNYTIQFEDVLNVAPMNDVRTVIEYYLG